MKEIIVGTSNPAKKDMVRAALLPIGVAVRGTDDLGISLQIDEDGITAQENARKKSLAYSQATNGIVLSIDNALYLEGLSDEEQPGINTRRIPGKAGRATDEELLNFYSKKIMELGGRVNGRWEFAVCIATPSGQLIEKTIISPRKFVSKPSQSLLPGYPLESIQIDPHSQRYISEMSSEEQALFWQEIVGKDLCELVQAALVQTRQNSS